MIIAKAPGTCGEYVQGIFWGQPGIISAPVNMYSITKISSGTGKRQWLPKTEMAYHKFFEKYNIDPKLGEKIDITVETELPFEKGMASSTADITSILYALAAYFKIDFSMYDAYEMAITIEPSDNITFPWLDLYNHYTGEIIIEDDYMSLEAPVLILDFNFKVNTIDFGYATEFQRSEELSKRSYYLFANGVSDQDLSMVGNATTMSALNNQTALSHPFIYQVKELSDKYGGLGLILGHSGSVIGILYDESFRKQEFIDQIKLELGQNLDGLYDKRLIKGGVIVKEVPEQS